MRGVDLIEMDDGKNVTNTAYYDGMAFARGAGLLPATGLRRRARHEERGQRGHQGAPGASRRQPRAPASSGARRSPSASGRVTVFVALVVGLVWWIAAWAFGIKAFDAFLLTVAWSSAPPRT